MAGIRRARANCPAAARRRAYALRHKRPRVEPGRCLALGRCPLGAESPREQLPGPRAAAHLRVGPRGTDARAGTGRRHRRAAAARGSPDRRHTDSARSPANCPLVSLWYLETWFIVLQFLLGALALARASLAVLREPYRLAAIVMAIAGGVFLQGIRRPVLPGDRQPLRVRRPF